MANPDNMQVLAFDLDSKLLYDFSSTEDFYVLRDGVLSKVSPKAASQYYCNKGNNITIIYNPFLQAIPPVGFSDIP